VERRVQPSPFTYAQRGQIIAAAIKYGLGTIFAFPAAARTKVELLVNLQTAKTLGIEVPLALLLRADELLE